MHVLFSVWALMFVLETEGVPKLMDIGIDVTVPCIQRHGKVTTFTPSDWGCNINN